MDSAWHPLFEPLRVEGEIEVQCLSSQRQLIEEGNVLRHCVGSGSYATACSSGRSHIVSIRENGMPIATLELRESPAGELRIAEGCAYTVKQFRGAENKNPPLVASEAWTKFLAQARGGSVTFNPETGA